MFRRLKRLFVLIFAGFLAFAPPGTLLLAGALVLRLLGRAWLLAGALCFVVFVGIWLLMKGRAARGIKHDKN